jgi:hypothetical protein
MGEPESHSVYRWDNWLDGQGSIPSRTKKIFSTPQCPDLLCDLRNLQDNGYQELFPGSKATGA